METIVQIVSPNDSKAFNELLSVFEIVFDKNSFRRPGPAHLQSLLMSGDFFAVVAKIDNKIIGGLTVYMLTQYCSERPQAYLYDLAVLPSFQRKGVGKRLVQFTNDYCRQKGFAATFVQAENANDQAVDFYRATAPTREEPVIQFTYQLNPS